MKQLCSTLLCVVSVFVASVSGKCDISVTTASGKNVPSKICSGKLIFEDNFNKLDLKKWQHENTLTGGENWEFQWYTTNRTNSFTKNGILYLRPTLLADQIGEENLYKMMLNVNQGSRDVCTNDRRNGCVKTGSAKQILNPIKSAKINTLDSFSFKYGKMDIRAKGPAGDWLWPGIYLHPKNEVYGPYPASGEIDLMESRGNKDFRTGTLNIGSTMMASTLHWGPNRANKQWAPTSFRKHLEPGHGFETAFRNYQLEWTPNYIKFSLDGETIGLVKPDVSFWEFGQFGQAGLENVWAKGTKFAPFDQEFYISMGLAVGGIDYFSDYDINITPKPWLNNATDPAADFWKGRSQWLPTWKMDEDNGAHSSFKFDYIRVWAL